jgi:hypothetical protein
MQANQESLLQGIFQEINNLNTWDCQFIFPDKRTSTGQVDRCNFEEFKGFFSGTIQQQSANKDEYGYYFDDAEFSGESGEQALKEALKSAARLAGFELLKHLTLPFKTSSLAYLGNTYPKMMESCFQYIPRSY